MSDGGFLPGLAAIFKEIRAWMDRRDKGRRSSIADTTQRRTQMVQLADEFAHGVDHFQAAASQGGTGRSRWRDNLSDHLPGPYAFNLKRARIAAETLESLGYDPSWIVAFHQTVNLAQQEFLPASQCGDLAIALKEWSTILEQAAKEL